VLLIRSAHDIRLIVGDLCQLRVVVMTNRLQMAFELLHLIAVCDLKFVESLNQVCRPVFQSVQLLEPLLIELLCFVVQPIDLQPVKLLRSTKTVQIGLPLD
jgi:hypothetical protein